MRGKVPTTPADEVADEGFVAAVFKVSSMKNGGVSVILHVPYMHADRAFALHRYGEDAMWVRFSPQP